MSSNDQTVSFDDLMNRHRRMQKETWEQLCARIDEREPSLVGYSMCVACKMSEYLTKCGASKHVSDRVMREVAKSMLMVVEATLDGQRLLWSDLLPHDDEEVRRG